jgi:hypothetical protein
LLIGREKLNKWLAAKGKTPSRYRHLMCFGVHGHGHDRSLNQSTGGGAALSSSRQKSNVQDESVVQALDLDMVLEAEVMLYLSLASANS